MNTEVRKTCPRCNGYGVLGYGPEPGLFDKVTEDPCSFCGGIRTVKSEKADQLRFVMQKNKDSLIGETPNPIVVSQIRRLLSALEVVEENYCSSSRSMLNTALQEFERLGRMVEYRKLEAEGRKISD